ncbi:MAG: hypothetical protein KDA22_10290 [Phycisphaerales bacterium]|nr:hypothetical protein [Phycisphaerales bacterium]
MPIDWFTVVAQGVNFLILVVLLRRFLYGPIQRAVAQRETRLQERLREAEEKSRAADEREASLANEQAELEATRDRAMADARAKADTERRGLTAAARRDVERARSEWMESFAQQRSAVMAQFARATTNAACDIARRTLRDLADASLEERLVTRFLGHLGALKDPERSAFADAARAADGHVTVRTGFPLSPEQKASLETGLADVLQRQPAIAFMAAGHGENGITVEASGRRIAWTLDRYVDEIQARLTADLDEELERFDTSASATAPRAEARAVGTEPSDGRTAASTASIAKLVPTTDRPESDRKGGVA